MLEQLKKGLDRGARFPVPGLKAKTARISTRTTAQPCFIGRICTGAGASRAGCSLASRLQPPFPERTVPVAGYSLLHLNRPWTTHYGSCIGGGFATTGAVVLAMAGAGWSSTGGSTFHLGDGAAAAYAMHAVGAPLDSQARLPHARLERDLRAHCVRPARARVLLYRRLRLLDEGPAVMLQDPRALGGRGPARWAALAPLPHPRGSRTGGAPSPRAQRNRAGVSIAPFDERISTTSRHNVVIRPQARRRARRASRDRR